MPTGCFHITVSPARNFAICSGVGICCPRLLNELGQLLE